MSVKSRVWLEINLDKLCSNFKKISGEVAPCKIIAVLKADAYGLGVKKIALALKSAGAAGFGVAELNEALELVPLGLPVLILGNILPDEIRPAIMAGVTIPVNDYESAAAVSREAVAQGKTAKCHFLIDTGMGRLGIIAAGAAETIIACSKLPGLIFEGMYSHFPVAYQRDSGYTRRQINNFTSLLADIRSAGIKPEIIHIANSDAINNYPDTFSTPFNHVRTGINLYGLFDNEGRRALDLEPVVELKTRLVAIRKMPAGSKIGYGCTCSLLKDTTVGVVAAGYADGLPLALSNRGFILVHDQLCPVLGRVSMDYTSISLDSVPEAVCGDEVICLGGSGANAIAFENWVQLKATHAYDLLCSFGSRVERRYTGGNE